MRVDLALFLACIIQHIVFVYVYYSFKFKFAGREKIAIPAIFVLASLIIYLTIGRGNFGVSVLLAFAGLQVGTTIYLLNKLYVSWKT